MSQTINLPDLLTATQEMGGSDLHLSMGSPPQVRVDGHLKRLDYPDLTPDVIKALVYSVLTDVQKKKFEETWELDLAFGLRGVGRFRCNVFNQKGAVGSVFRLIPEKIRSLEETVRLETRAKTLNPKWYEGMLQHGFRGVAEIENHVSNTFGWSATADAVDDWIYSEVANTFVFDESMLERLKDLNPHSAHALVQRLLEATARGFWETDAALLDKLQEISRDLEDQLEGVA